MDRQSEMSALDCKCEAPFGQRKVLAAITSNQNIQDFDVGLLFESNTNLYEPVNIYMMKEEHLLIDRALLYLYPIFITHRLVSSINLIDRLLGFQVGHSGSND